MKSPHFPDGTAFREWSGKLRVLIVDDYPDAAESLAMLVKIWNHEVAICHSGPEALKLARTFRPSAALVDIALPGMDGFQLAHRLREQSDSKPIALISVTGFTEEKYRRLSQQAGFALHLVKPVDLEQLEAFLELLSEERETHPRRMFKSYWPLEKSRPSKPSGDIFGSASFS